MNTNHTDDERFEKLPREVQAHLGYYVYLYSYPDTGKPFYVGKGVGERVLAHQDVTGNSDKARVLAELRARGKLARLTIVRHGKLEAEALVVEAVLIEHIGLENLVNKVAGHGTQKRGRMSLKQLHSRYAAESVKSFHEPTLLFRLTRSFRYSMVGEDASDESRRELFEATSGTWVLGANREKIIYAMAVYDNVIQEVYKVCSWQPGGTAEYKTRDMGGVDPGRWEFTGSLCIDEQVRSAYVGKKVKHLFPHGFTGGFRYCWPGEVEESGAD